MNKMCGSPDCVRYRIPWVMMNLCWKLCQEEESGSDSEIGFASYKVVARRKRKRRIGSDHTWQDRYEQEPC